MCHAQTPRLVATAGLIVLGWEPRRGWSWRGLRATKILEG